MARTSSQGRRPALGGRSHGRAQPETHRAGRRPARCRHRLPPDASIGAAALGEWACKRKRSAIFQQVAPFEVPVFDSARLGLIRPRVTTSVAGRAAMFERRPVEARIVGGPGDPIGSELHYFVIEMLHCRRPVARAPPIG